uniref:F-box-like family protein n=1 Tax=Pithovirus LCPAC401 TaxID=2506595 RepID=A0A481ZA41_9VIRU|nr:MAG: F-box-like family protein [Pithovirus LCPAC401]
MDSISSDSLQTIFTYLDIGEISRKCLTNHLFDRVCRPESLWKNKLSKEYSVVENGNETWRSKAKEVYIESISFWKNVDDFIDYYMVRGQGTDDLIEKFEKRLIDHALREKKEFFTIEIIFRAPGYHTMYYIEIINRFRSTFISLFEKAASLSLQKKISIKWILNLIDEDELEHECECDTLWKIEGLVLIYLKYEHLFIDDAESYEWRKELIRQSV